MSLCHPERLFPTDSKVRETAKEIYGQIKDLPILSPHGHTDPEWFATNQPFPDAANLLFTPDHYLFRMLYSAGIPLDELGIGDSKASAESVWTLFAKNFYRFRGTPSAIWLNHTFETVFGISEPLNEKTAADYFKVINEKLKTPEFLPRSLFEKFNIEFLATTDNATDDLNFHKQAHEEWCKKLVPTFRPDKAIDPGHEEFVQEVGKLGEITGENVSNYSGYIKALEQRRSFFKSMGTTATDHGPETPFTTKLSDSEAQTLLDKALKKQINKDEEVRLRGHMLTEMARMSCEDGLVMQLHSGSFRNHNEGLFHKYGRDVGADIPQSVNFVSNLKPLLDAYGNNKNLNLILFTLDETTYSRELAPLAGHYPSLKLGPAWWFHDSVEGMKRFRQQTTETAGFYNTVGFIDDTRAFFSIPARHDVARRVDARLLAQWVHEHRMTEQEAVEVAIDLTDKLPREAFNIGAAN